MLTKAILSLSSSIRQGRENTTGSWVRVRVGGDQSPLLSWAKQTQHGEVNLLPIESEEDNDKLNQNTFLPSLHFSWAEFHSEILVPPLPQQHRGTGHGAVVSSSYVVSAAAFLLIQRTPSPAQGPSHGKSPSLTSPT